MNNDKKGLVLNCRFDVCSVYTCVYICVYVACVRMCMLLGMAGDAYPEGRHPSLEHKPGQLSFSV